MNQEIEINQGEVKVNFSEPLKGKLSFAELGLKDEDLVFEGGFMRVVFNFEGIGEHNYYHMPTIEIAYKEEMAETHWQCDFNETTLLDKMDHHGHSTVILMNRKKLSEAEHHHRNALILHAEFPQGVHVKAEDSYVNFFQ